MSKSSFFIFLISYLKLKYIFFVFFVLSFGWFILITDHKITLRWQRNVSLQFLVSYWVYMFYKIFKCMMSDINLNDYQNVSVRAFRYHRCPLLKHYIFKSCKNFLPISGGVILVQSLVQLFYFRLLSVSNVVHGAMK